MSPAANQPRREVFELRQLDLKLTLKTSRTLRENIEDQPGAIQHPALELAFQVAFLAGAQRRTGNDQLSIVLLNQ